MTILSPCIDLSGKGGQPASPNFFQKPCHRRALHAEYAAESSYKWSEPQLYNVMAVCNGLAWQASKQMSVAERIRFEGGGLGPILIHSQNAHRLWNPEIDIRIASTWLESHLNERCDRTVSRRSINRILDWMRDLGLVQWEEGIFEPKAPRSAAKSRLYRYIDVPRLLVMQEAIEDYLLKGTEAGREFGLNILPRHRYGSSVLLFEAVFPGFGWNRNGDGSEVEPTTIERSIDRREFLAEQTKAKRAEYSVGSRSALLQVARLGDEEQILETFKDLSRFIGKDKQSAWDVAECLRKEDFEAIAEQWLEFYRG